jgi:hypothetical protein
MDRPRRAVRPTSYRDFRSDEDEDEESSVLLEETNASGGSEFEETDVSGKSILNKSLKFTSTIRMNLTKYRTPELRRLISPPRLKSLRHDCLQWNKRLL